jgi:hypothetical protein
LWQLFFPQPPKSEVKGWLGVDLGLAAIAHTSDDGRFAGGSF